MVHIMVRFCSTAQSSLMDESRILGLTHQETETGNDNERIGKKERNFSKEGEKMKFFIRQFPRVIAGNSHHCWCNMLSCYKY